MNNETVCIDVIEVDMGGYFKTFRGVGFRYKDRYYVVSNWNNQAFEGAMILPDPPPSHLCKVLARRMVERVFVDACIAYADGQAAFKDIRGHVEQLLANATKEV